MHCQNCGKSNQITINQKRYCANCGNHVAHVTSATTATIDTRPGHVLDLSAKTAHSLVRPSASAAVPPVAEQARRLSRRPQGAHAVHHTRTQSSRRSHKPSSPAPAAARPSIVKPKVRPVVQAVAAPKLQPVATAVVTPPKPKTARSSLISKFGPSPTAAVPATTATLAKPSAATMAPHPLRRDAAAAAKRPQTAMNPRRSYRLSSNTLDIAAQIATHHQRRPALATPRPANLEQHLQPAKPKRRKRLAKLTHYFKARPRFSNGLAISLSALALVGYITYLNYPNISLRIAASRAGFTAQMPHYTPSGYNFDGRVAYSPGQITVRFNSQNDTGFVTVTQRKTSWDSVTLLENFISPKTDQYTTFQENGLTIYIYDGSNATWVNSGIWYSIEGNNQLNPEQIIKMAVSM